MSNPGSAGVASHGEAQRHHKERMRQIALETADLAADPYFSKSHTGVFECRLCLTLHRTEASYLSHTQGRKHQTNLGRREAKLKRAAAAAAASSSSSAAAAAPPSTVVRIGRPGYRAVKQRDASTGELSLLFRLEYPRIDKGMQPRHRLVGAYEQRVEEPDARYQYLLFAAEPYETVAFKVPAAEVDRSRLLTHWDKERHAFTLQLVFRKR